MFAADFNGFDAGTTGTPPAHWTSTLTGEGTARWEVVADPSAPSPPNVLKQGSITPKSSFPLCLQDTPPIRDGSVQVEFKTISGKIDQAAGVVWRAEDAANYYVCRANALEDNVVLYKVEKGKRTALDIVGRAGGYGVEIKVAPAQWHTLRVDFAGNRFRVSFNGKPLFEVEDSSLRRAGRVGLWTKADSVTLFDNFACVVEER